MATIVGVHGIGQRSKSEDILHAEWFPPLCEGIESIGMPGVLPEQLKCVFYGDLFLDSGTRSFGQEWTMDDLTEKWEQEFAGELDAEAARVLGEDPEERVRFVRISGMTQLGFRFLLRVPGFGSLTESTVINWFVKEAYRYMHDPEIRETARQRIVDAITDDTRIVFAHSLGTVAAYEALALSRKKIDLFITAGSPLGIPRLFYEKLHPELEHNERRGWPVNVKRWVNLSQPGDVVCLRKSLRDLFYEYRAEIEDHLLPNPGYFRAHDADNYLRSPEAAKAVASILHPAA